MYTSHKWQTLDFMTNTFDLHWKRADQNMCVEGTSNCQFPVWNTHSHAVDNEWTVNNVSFPKFPLFQLYKSLQRSYPRGSLWSEYWLQSEVYLRLIGGFVCMKRFTQLNVLSAEKRCAIQNITITNTNTWFVDNE